MGVQQALRDLDASIDAVASSGMSQSDIDKIVQQVIAKITPATPGTTVQQILNTNNVFRGSGVAHAIGLVPDPGLATPIASSYEVIDESGSWAWPLHGGLQRVDSPGDDVAGNTSTGTPAARYQLDGILTVLGAINCGNIIAGGLQVGLPRCLVQNSANISTSTGVNTVLTFDTIKVNSPDPQGNLLFTSSANSKITATNPSFMLCGGTIEWASAAGTARQAAIRKNGDNNQILPGLIFSPPVSGSVTRLSATSFAMMGAGDYVELLAFQDAGTVNVDTAGTYSPTFWAVAIPL